MNKKHPKRKKDKLNTYKLEIKNNRYYLSFVDGQNKRQKIEIDEQLYNLFNNFELEDISYINKVSRYHEHFNLSEETINNRAFNKSELLEDVVMLTSQSYELYSAISQLSNIQQRRLILYYFEDLTYEQIAESEGCSFQAVAKSISIAEKRLKKILNKG